MDDAENGSVEQEKINGGEEMRDSEKSVNSRKLRRELGFVDGLCFIVCIMIGSGIFASPGVALDRAGSPGAALVAWVVAGLLVLTASFCYAELGAMLPSAGGEYEFLSVAYGRRASFSFAWYLFWIAKPGSQAIIATVFGNYMINVLTGLNDSNQDSYYSKILAIGLIICITSINCFGVKETSLVTNFLSGVKICSILIVCTAGIIYLATDETGTLSGNLSPSQSFQGSDAVGIFSGLIPCLWAYDGWADIVYLAEEMHSFESRLPLMIVSGISTVMVCYISANVSYLAVLSQDTIIDSDAIAIDFGKQASGQIFGGALAILVALSTMGSANGSIMSGGRAFYSMARSGQMPSAAAKLNSNGVPYIALLFQASWCICLILMPGSSFASLLDYAGPAGWLYYALTGSSVLYLRKTRPDIPRPFSVPCFPLPPILLVIMAITLLVSSLMRSPLYCLLAMFFIAISVPVWLVVERFLDENQIKTLRESLTGSIIDIEEEYVARDLDERLLSDGVASSSP